MLGLGRWGVLVSCGSFGTRLVNSNLPHISSFPRTYSAHKPGEGAEMAKRTVLTFSRGITQELLNQRQKAGGIKTPSWGSRFSKHNGQKPPGQDQRMRDVCLIWPL